MGKKKIYERKNLTGESKYIINKVNQTLKRLEWRLTDKSSNFNYNYNK